jgi:hypothetical protein
MKNNTDWSALLTELQSAVPNTTISDTEWREAEAETPPYQLWFILAAAVFFAVTMVYGGYRNRQAEGDRARWLRQLNVSQGHYSGFLLGHALREVLRASGVGGAQIDRILHIATIPANMGIAMGTGFPFSPIVTGRGELRDEVLGSLPTYNVNGFSQVQLVIFLKAMVQSVVAFLSYLGIGQQAVSTVYPSLVIGEFLYMVSVGRGRNTSPPHLWANESPEVRRQLESNYANLLYGMPGALGATFLVGGMWQGYTSDPPNGYWGQSFGAAEGGLGVGWNTLTMIAVEEIIYIGWIASQYLGYRRYRSRHEIAAETSVEVPEIGDRDGA